MKLKNISVCLFLMLSLTGYSQATSLADAYDNLIVPFINDGLFDYEAAIPKKQEVIALKELIADTDLNSMNETDKKAFLINAYNVLVISDVLAVYPLRSVQDEERFFNRTHLIGGQDYSLDQIEKTLLNPASDPRIHMVLVCGAISCPPLPSMAMRGDNIESMMESATRKALNYRRIIEMEEDELKLSQIFRWYINDFGDLDAFILKYRRNVVYVIENKKFQDYNWALNDTKNGGTTSSAADQDIRFFTSYLYGKGQYEVSVFNNYFTELRADDFRNNFFTSFIRYTYGYNKKINFSVDLKLRSVSFGDKGRISRFESLAFGNEGRTIEDGQEVSFRKFGISAIIPRVKYQPFADKPNLSIQHSVAIPTNYGEDGGFLDWGSPSIYNDAFYDITVGSKSSIFLQASVWLENIGSAMLRRSDGYYQFSMPLTFIYQYFPTDETTIYLLTNYAPQWGYSVTANGDQVDVIGDSYQQLGLGLKQYVSETLQLELLYTKFFSAREGASSHTYNLGLRYFGW